MAEAASRDDALPAALAAWLAGRGFTLFDFQREAIDAWRRGESGLVHSATGTGKTLAAWLGPVAEGLEAPTPEPPPIRVLWVTPLRALAADIAHNLRRTAEETGLNWTVELRSGDSTSSDRARQRRRLPTALVTTPESLALLLSYPETVRQLRSLRGVVVDEWHELLGNKRGTLLELGLARLRSLAPELRTWGLSATLGNTTEALDVLLGGPDRGRLVGSEADQPVEVTTLIPASLERFPWGGHIGLKQLHAVADAIDGARSTLVFCNTRFQAEAWFDALLRARIDWVDRIALHHGSLDRALRTRVETLLRDGALKCVVATSSLDLGVDFTPVEQVVQIGGPKGVARLLQRAGRSGHGPGRTSKVLCAPSHALEMLEYAAARRAITAGRIEPRRPVGGALDVLAQHVVTRLLGEAGDEAALLAELRDTISYRDLTDAHWRWTLDFLENGGAALHAYPEYQRLRRRGTQLTVASPAIGRRHRMAVGTITADATVTVQWLGGSRIGHVEESFVARLSPGDRFMFAGRVLELVRVRDMTALVRRAKSVRRAIPRWAGGRLPLSSELADGVLALFEAHEARATGAHQGDAQASEPELEALAPLLEVQRTWSGLPGRRSLLVEQLRTREGHHLFVYPFAGRLVHEGLATLLAWRLGQQQPATFTTTVNDYGLELLTADDPDVDETRLRNALTPENLADDILACMNAGELSRRRFREIARIAGLVFQGFPGAGKSTKALQASSGLVHDVLERHDPENLLLDQARREVLEQELEATRLGAALERIQGQTLRLERPDRLTPLAFPLWVDRISTRLSTESWQTRVDRMLDRLEAAAGATASRSSK